jgi:phosphatidylserine/phosphatidylglycerophosphate/cardiolipin synthase-like enzyme
LKKFIILIVIISNCYTKNSNNNYLLLNLIENSIYAIFSYPGRYNEISKKREVLDEILQILDSTNENLYIYAYSFNHPEIIEKLKSLKQKGVKVFLVLDKDKNYPLLDSYGIPKQLWKGSGLHHLKIIISDHKKIFMGTGNFSEFGLTNDWNGYIVINTNKNFADKFILNLEEKISSIDLSTNDLKLLFSPEKGILIQDVILNEMSKAKESIKILTFDHYDEIFSHVVKKASLRGVEVKIIYNDPVDPEGLYLNTEFFGLNSKILRDGNFDTIEKLKGFPEGGLLHHKTIIIDNKVLLTGSYNFSTNARNNNREIHIKTTNPILIKSFLDEFDRIEKSSYLTYPTKRNFESNKIKTDLSFQSDRVCMTSNLIGSSTVEIGEGIFKTYLRYSRLKPNNCFIFESFDDISTGVSNFKKEKSTRSDFLWNNFYSLERRGNTIIYNSSSFNILDSSSIFLNNPTQIDFSLKDEIILNFKENNIKSNSQIFYYSPSFPMHEGKIFLVDNKYHINITLTPEEKKRGAFFIREDRGDTFGCFYTLGFESDSINFLKEKLIYNVGILEGGCKEIR